MSVTLISIVILCTVLYLVGTLSGRLLRRRWAKVVLAPGLLVHTVFQVIACLLTGARVRGFHPWADGPELLEVTPSPVRHLGPSLQVLIRLALGFATLYVVLFMYFPEFIDSGFVVPYLDEEALIGGHLRWSTLEDFRARLLDLPRHLVLHRLAGVAFVYTLVAYSMSCGMKTPDLVASLWAVCGLFTLGWISNWLGLTFGFLSRGQLIQIFLGSTFWTSFCLLLGSSLLALGLVATWRLGATIVQWRSRRG